MVNEVIKILGAKTHNLKNIDVDIPINKLICIFGPSGSGKSSLAFHTLALESKRRFLNSLPNDVKFFWDTPHQVDVEQIYPVLPVMTMPQRNPVVGARSSVVDVLGLTELMQKLFYFQSKEYCPIHEQLLTKKNISSFIAEKKFSPNDVLHLCLQALDYKKNLRGDQLPVRSFNNNEIGDFQSESLYWELLRFKNKNFEETFEKNNIDGFALDHPILIFSSENKEAYYYNFNSELKCPHCDFVPFPRSMQLFSPYNPLGACKKCNGYGMTLEYDESRLFRDLNLSISEGGVHFLKSAHVNYFEKYFVSECKKHSIDINTPVGKLLKSKGFRVLFYEGSGKYPGFNEMIKYLVGIRYKKTVRIFLRSIQKEEICSVCENTRIGREVLPYKVFLEDRLYSMDELLRRNIFALQTIFGTIKSSDRLIKAIKTSLTTALDLGLGHLNILRKVKSITSSEYQRLLLVKFLSFEGSGVLFILDEPTHSLAIDEQEKVWKYLCKLRDQENTVLMVEHSEFMQKNSDHLINIGPGAGAKGGYLQWQGHPKDYKFEKLETAKRKEIKTSKEILIKGLLTLSGEKRDLLIRKNVFNWIHGGSGTGKTSVVRSFIKTLKESDYIYVDSSYEKTTSRSTVGSYTELFTVLRKYYVSLDDSKKLGLRDGHFSPNSELGMCLSCDGRGVKIVDMQFLEDLEFVCDECHGSKLKRQISKISDGNYSYGEAVKLPILECFKPRKLTPKFTRILKYIEILNLGHLSLDREVQSLSGGEAARLKLLKALQGCLENRYIILENVSLGLSTIELAKISTFLGDLLLLNNTVILIDQNELFKKFAHHEILFSREKITYNKLD